MGLISLMAKKSSDILKVLDDHIVNHDFVAGDDFMEVYDSESLLPTVSQ